MLDRTLKLAQTGAALAVLVFFLSASYVVLRAPNLLLHADGTLTRTEAVLSKTRATMSNLDAATKIWAGSAKEQTEAVEDLATDAHGTLSQANNALYSINESAHALGEDLGALHQTIDAGTETAHQAAVDLRTLDDSFNSLQPLVADSGRAVSNLNALLENQAIHRTLDNVAAMTDSGNGILLDFRKVADKESADWLRPVPWWRVPIQKGGALIDIGAAVARHTP